MADVKLTFDARLRPFMRKTVQAIRRIDRLNESVKRLTRAMARRAREQSDDMVFRGVTGQASIDPEREREALIAQERQGLITFGELAERLGREAWPPPEPRIHFAPEIINEAGLPRLAGDLGDRIASWAAVFAIAWIVGVSLAVWAGVIG